MLVVTLKVNINSRHYTFIRGRNAQIVVALADSYSSSSFVANMEVVSIPVFSSASGGPTHSIAYRCPMSTSCLRPGVPAAPCPCVLSRQGEERCVGQSSAGGLRHTATPPLLHFSVSSLSLVTAGSRAGARSCREETPALQHTAPLSSSL